VLWGGLHGLYLIINHGWRKLFPVVDPGRLRKSSGWTVTMLVVVVAWVPFRAESLNGAMAVLSAMIGSNGLSLPENLIGRLGSAEQWLIEHGAIFQGMFHNGIFGSPERGIAGIVALILVAAIFPNTQQFMRRYRPAFETYHGEIQRLRYRWLEWRPSKSWGIFIGVLFLLATLSLSKPSEFLYFQF